MNILDNLFNEKLADHTVAPSQEAWNRIEAGLSKKNNSIIWMRWAAILIAGALVGLLIFHKPDQAPKLAKQAPKLEAPASPLAHTVTKTERTQVALPATRKKIKPVHKRNSASTTAEPSYTPITIATSLPERIAPMADVAIEPVTKEVPQVMMAESKPIVLVYTLESIIPSPQPEEKKTSIGRVVEFAKTVKHSDPISDLRGIKDELLAINWRKKSTKKN